MGKDVRRGLRRPGCRPELCHCFPARVFPGGSAGKESTCNVGDLGLIPGWEDPLEKGQATHSSILAWRTP